MGKGGRNCQRDQVSMDAGISAGAGTGTGASVSSPAKRPRRPDPSRDLPLDQLQELRQPQAPRRLELPEPAEFFALHQGFDHAGLALVERDPYLHTLDDGTQVSTRGWGEDYQYNGELVDAQGQVQGTVKRQMSQDAHGRLYVKLEHVRLHPDAQGKGVGPALHAFCEQRYREAGVSYLEVAAVEMGAYVWTRSGDFYFDIRPQRSARGDVQGVSHDHPGWDDPHFCSVAAASALWQDYNSRIDPDWTPGACSREEFAAYKRMFASAADLNNGRWRRKLCTPQQVGMLGHDRPFTDKDGNQSWAGKHLLMGLLSERHYEIAYNNRTLGEGYHRPPYRSAAWSGVRLLNL